MTTLITAPQIQAHPAGRLAHILDAADAAQTPSLLIDTTAVAANHRRIRAAFAGAQVYYAVKANPHPRIVDTLAQLGCGLDVASGPEVRMALDAKISPERICFSAPFKRGADIATAHAHGIGLYVADSPGEVENIARHAPGARILIRMAVRGGHALTPMGKKFGANPGDVVALFKLAAERGLEPYGMHFHVGSQCLDPLAWSHAIAECAPIWHAARAVGMDLRLIDIGGGFPVRYDSDVPEIEEIASPTMAAARVWLGPEVQIALEPGRWMTCDAAVLVTEVIGLAERGDDCWTYLDAGVYNGLVDTVEGVVYPLYTPDELQDGSSRPRLRQTLAGPSCDGNDVMYRSIEAPEVRIGDRLLFFQAGAYTTSFERFNGLAFPEVVEVR